MSIISAVILGTLFGFVLQRVGAADPDRIIGMLQLRDLHLMKVILFAIGLSSILLFVGMTMGVIDPGHLSIKSLYVGVIIGGLLLGLGWAIAGFCPGTGVVAAGAGRRDALVFVIGGLVGAGLFTWMYGQLQSTVLFNKLLGGDVTLAATGQASALLDINGLVVAGVVGVVFILIAWLLPSGQAAS